MTAWIKNLTVSVCILTILMHLIPGGKFKKYVKFYSGLLFFLLASEPVFLLSGQSGELERLLQLEFLKEDYYDMETAVAGMADLKQTEIRMYYQQEILRQMRETAAAYGLEVLDARAEFASEDGFGVTQMTLTVKKNEGSEQAVYAVKQELEAVYAVDSGRIMIVQQ